MTQSRYNSENRAHSRQQQSIKQVILYGLLILFVIALLPRLYTILTWNLANVLLVHAQLAENSSEMYRSSTLANGLLARVKPTTPGKEQALAERINKTNQLQWRSASALGHVGAALGYYAQMTGQDDQTVDVTCPQEMPYVYEASTFNGVTADGLAKPRYVGDSTNVGVILFTTTPAITKTICVKRGGLYTIGVAAAENNPPPIQIEIKWDEWYVGRLEYSKGDNSISTKRLQVVIPPGEYELSLRFANDFSNHAIGIDRNALIDHVEISRY